MQAKNYQLVEVLKPAAINSAGDRLYIGDQPQLRTLENRLIQFTAISIYPAEACPAGPSGTPTITTADLLKAFLVLNVGSIDKYLYIPMVELIPVVPNGITGGTYAPGVREYFQLNKTTQVDCTKSYFQFAGAPAATDLAILLGVRYYVLPKDILPTENPGV